MRHTLPAPPFSPEALIERRATASTREWLADLDATFDTLVLAFQEHLSSDALHRQYANGRLGLLLTRGEWRAVLDAARHHVGSLRTSRHP